MNWGRILHTLGTFSLALASVLVVPAACALWYGEYETLPAFGWSAGVGLLCGFVLRYVGRKASRELHRRDALMIVTSTWVAAGILGALPFIFSGMIPRFESAVFESVSGFTTTGSTVLDVIDGQPRGLMFWRAMTQWLGGMGIIVLFVAILPALGVGARMLYQFEVPGLESEDLRPRIRETANLLWRIYLLMTLIETVLLMFCGLDAYEALTHTFCTVSTGGYSSHSASIDHFASPAVEIVITVFMFLSGASFVLYWRAWKQGPQVMRRDPEFRVYAAIMIGASLLTAGILIGSGTYSNPVEATRDSFFQVVSIGTTTGYGTADFDQWPHVIRLLLVVLMFVGGCAGSTAGGMKVVRVMLVMRFIGHEIRRFVRPKHVKRMMLGGQPVEPAVVNATMAFFALMVLIFLGSSLAMTAMGLDPDTALTSVAATLGNIGPGLNQVGPTLNFAEVPAIGKVLLTLLMLLGRLELFTALVVMTPAFYRN